ncbi:MAG: YbaY family lipoprotein [Bryobacterales bacterium]|nr:YbaY family lipoprotein [Bryobacterales bacterium]
MWFWRNLPTAAAILALFATPALAQQGKVNGRLNLGEANVPPEAEVEVMLLDVSHSKVSSLLVSQKKFAAGSEVPINFTLTYDKAKIDATHDYAVFARIMLGGRTRFAAERKAPVITKGNSVNVEIPMRSVGRHSAMKP